MDHVVLNALCRSLVVPVHALDDVVFQLSRVFVRFNHVASFIVNANQSMM
jgi:hypothetical protein